MSVRRTGVAMSLVLAAGASTAVANPMRITKGPPPGVDEGPAPAIVSNIIFVNRCKDGCTYHAALTNNARLDQFNLGVGQLGDPYVILPCTDPQRMNAPTCDDGFWADVMACVTKVYAPYD